MAIYAVCKDLGKTFDEIIKLPPPIIYWHVLNTNKSKIQEIEEKEEGQNLQILLQRPDWYKAMQEADKNTIENALFEETVNEDGVVMSTMTPDEFKKLVKQQQELIKNNVVIYRQEEGKDVLNVGGIVNDEYEDEYDINPIFSERY